MPSPTVLPTFSIRSLIREQIDASPEFSIADLSKTISERVPEDHLTDALAEALPSLIRDIVRSTRHDTISVPPSAVEASEDGCVTPIDTPRRLPAHVSSPRVAAIREQAWQRQLRAIYSTPSGVMKRLSEFSAGELVALADEFHRQGVSNLTRERQTRLLASDMQDHECEHLSDLDAAIIAKRLGGESA